MTDRPAEVTELHTRIMRCALEVEDARAYWKHVDPDAPPVSAEQAFTAYWFGARSLPRIEVLLANFRARFDAFPESLRVLHRWVDMDPATRRLVCHWHLQLADPLYRAFTGDWLVQRRAGARPTVTRDLVVGWVAAEGREHWKVSSRIQFASKLLSAAYAAGLVGTTRDPRPLAYPRVTDVGLTYLLYLLRGIRFAGSMLTNPYLASVGLADSSLEDRLRGLTALGFRRQGDLVDFGWQYDSLAAWATATLFPTDGDAPLGAHA